MATKHVINEPRELVNEALKGLIRINPSVRLDEANRVTVLKEVPQDRVALISGGGSGHEPGYAGFVGAGLLTASISGNVFASPNVGQIRKAIDLVDNKKGTLAVIMRYTGDVLLFGLAKEQQAVTHPDKQFRLTIVGDDCAVPRKQGAIVGRRGLAGTVLVAKIAGALAATGASIDETYEMAEYVATRVGTMGVSLEHCHVPGTAVPDAHLGGDEVEFGAGIHNESGVLREKLTTSKKMVKKMLAFITDTNDKERGFLPFQHDGKDEVVLLVNNLGSISELELSSIANDALETLAEQNIKVKRVRVGTYLTSLNMPGFSFTLLLLPRVGDNYSADHVIDLLDAPASPPGWPAAPKAEPGTPAPAGSSEVAEPVPIKSGGAPISYDCAFFEKAALAAASYIVKAEPEITRFDTIAGDGDCGLTLKAGAEGIVAAFKEGKVDQKDVVTAVLNLAQTIEKNMDGTSGALYSIWSNALAAGLAKAGKEGGSATAGVWASALAHALQTLYTYTAARRPSRTLVDPLDAFTNAFSESNGTGYAAAVKAAAEASEKTKDLVALAGRAAYVGREALQDAQVPDPGAHGVRTILEGIQSAL